MRQYGNSPVIQSLVSNLEQYFDADTFVDEFYDQIWNIDTANSFGLDIWGRIVGIDRYLNVKKQETNFGFNTPNKSFAPFNVAPFRNGDPSTTTYRLNDDAYRKLIMVKAFSNIVRPNAPAINQILQYLFDGKRCYVLDLGSMAMRYVFAFYLQPYERAIVESDVFSRPAGVRVEIVEIPQPNVFGFNEAGQESAPFNQGTFYTS